jgi:hypothetical protein
MTISKLCARAVLAALVALTLANEASASSEGVIKEYHAAMESCAYQSVLQFDDHISSAVVVGRAIFDQCKGDHFDLWEAFVNVKSASYVDAYAEAQSKWMIGLVLYVRAHPDEIKGAADGNSAD